MTVPRFVTQTFFQLNSMNDGVSKCWRRYKRTAMARWKFIFIMARIDQTRRRIPNACWRTFATRWPKNTGYCRERVEKLRLSMPSCTATGRWQTPPVDASVESILRWQYLQKPVVTQTSL